MPLAHRIEGATSAQPNPRFGFTQRYPHIAMMLAAPAVHRRQERTEVDMHAAKSPSGEAKSARLQTGKAEPVDLAHLGRYTFGDRILEKEVLALFIAQLPEMLTALSAASSESEWKMAAHTLKGSSRAVGAWPMGNLAEDAETLPFVQDEAARQSGILKLREAAAHVQAFILSAYGTA